MPKPNRAHSQIHLAGYNEAAIADIARNGREAIGGKTDCLLAFISPGWADQIDDLIEILQIEAHCPVVAGCSADGFIGTREEAEDTEGASFLFLGIPDADISLERFQSEQVPPRPNRGQGSITLLNPFALEIPDWVRAWNRNRPRGDCYGGLASGSQDGSRLLAFSSGGGVCEGLAVHFGGSVQVGGLVSQGCRPIGEPYTITEVDGNVIMGIGSQRAYDVLEKAYGSLSDDERSIANGNILAGFAMDEYREEFGGGDFLVSSILGGDPDAGALAVAAYPQVGQTLQFQLRDRASAEEDLLGRLGDQRERHGDPFASLAFSCTGRGRRMFGKSRHDASAVDRTFPDLPLAGFFGNGELGPVGGSIYAHGFSAAVALFRDA